MKKLIAVVGALLFAGSTFAVAAVPSLTATKIKNSQLVQGPVVVNMDGIRISVPQGQTVIIGKRDNGSIVIRGLNFNNIKINDASVYTKGYTIMSYRPGSQVAFLNKGEALTVVDAAGRSSTVGQGGAISAKNAEINSTTVAEMKEMAKEEAKAAVEEGIITDEDVVPAFVAATATSPAAVEQAVQNVEDTLSPSAPRN